MAQYTIDPEDLVKQRIADRLAIQQGLPQQGADLEQRFPMTQAMPNATAETQGMATPQQVDYTMNQLQQRFPSVEGGPGMQVPQEPSIGEQVASNPEIAFQKMGVPPEMAKELAKHLADSGPPKLIGKDIFGQGSGGIMGTGITPLSVLAHVFGAAITSRLPQEQAIAATLKIGGLPSEIRAAQQKASADVINQLISGGNTGVAYQGAQVSKAKLEETQQQLGLRKTFTQNILDSLAKGETTMSQQQKLLGVAAKMLPITVLNQETALVKTVMKNEAGQDMPVQVVVDKATHQPILDQAGKPTAFPLPETTGGAKDVSQRTREILAADKETGGTMTIGQAHEKAKAEEMSIFGNKASVTAEHRPARNGTYSVGGKVADTPYDAQEAQALLKQSGAVFYPQGSDKEKFFKAGNILSNHIDETLKLATPIFTQYGTGDHNKLVQFGKTKLAELTNDPNVKALIDSLGPASAFAASAPYIAASSGMRGGPRIAEMFKNGFYSQTDTFNSFLKKMETFTDLNIMGLKDEGIDYSRQAAQLQTIRDLQLGMGQRSAAKQIGGNLTATHSYNPATGKIEEIKK